MRLSLLELPTLVRRALLVAGMPRGAVDVAARMIAWAEIEQGDGLSFLESHLPEIARDGGARVRLLGEAPYAARLATDGASPLLFGPLMLDLATSRARRTGFGLVLVADGAWASPLGWMADQAGRRGLIALLAADRRSVIALPGPAAAASPGRIEPRYPDHAAAFLRLGSSAPPPARTADALARFLACGPDAGGADPGTMTLLCADPDAFGGRAALAAIADAVPAEAVGRSPQQIDARRDAAVRDGIEIDESLWLRLRRFGDRVLVPNSERSRQGAG